MLWRDRKDAYAIGDRTFKGDYEMVVEITWSTEWTLGTAVSVLAGLLIYIIANPAKVEKWSAIIAGLLEKISGSTARHAAAAEVQSDVSSYVKETNSAAILPYGLKIEWVKQDDVEASVNKRRNEVVVIMKYKKDNARNFITAVCGYTSKAFIPRIRYDAPKYVVSAAELVVQEKLIRAKREDALGIFNTEILPLQIGASEKVREMHRLLKRIDRLGFFENIFLNELLIVGDSLKNFDDPLKTDDIEGLVDFLNGFYSRAHREDVPLEYHSKLFWLNIILVAKTGVIPRAGTAPYVNRAKLSLSKGIRSIYVTGTKDDRRYVRDTVKNISDQNVAKLEWMRDYKKIRGMEIQNYTIAFFRQ